MRESGLPWSKGKGHKRKYRSWKMEVHIDDMTVIKTNLLRVFTYTIEYLQYPVKYIYNIKKCL